MADERDDLNLGHNSAGSDCTSKVFYFGSKGAIAGGLFGSVESCFLPPVAMSKPMFMRSITHALGRSMLGGFAGGLFAASACLSASFRNKDDYKNAAVGGAMAGTCFGVVSRSLPIGLCTSIGLATVFGAIKLMHGTYLPSLPSQTATTQAPDQSYVQPRPSGRMQG